MTPPNPARCLRLLTLSALALALGLGVTAPLSGCGGEEGTTTDTTTETTGQETPPAPVSRSGGESVSATVGAPGGMLELSNGIQVRIPSGAVREATEMTLSLAAPSSTLDAREGRQALGPIFQVEPGAQSAGGPFRVSAPFPGLPDGFETEDLAIAVEVPDPDRRALDMGSDRTVWQFAPVSVEGDRIVAQLATLSGLRLAFIAAR